MADQQSKYELQAAEAAAEIESVRLSLSEQGYSLSPSIYELDRLTLEQAHAEKQAALAKISPDVLNTNVIEEAGLFGTDPSSPTPDGTNNIANNPILAGVTSKVSEKLSDFVDNPILSRANFSIPKSMPISIKDDAPLQSLITPASNEIRPSDFGEEPVVKDAKSVFTTPIRPAPNKLGKFSSYSYTVSIYMATLKQYAELRKEPSKSINGYQLILQSGGVPAPGSNTPSGPPLSNTPISARANSAEVTRNEYFMQDFFIDDIEISNLISFHASGAPHFATSVSFKIIEPYGISFIDRLKKAVKKFNVDYGVGNNYASSPYLMVIRFYGYDHEGNLVLGSRNDLSDPSSIDEKIIPFLFTGITFRVAASLTEYVCKCVPIWQNVGLGSTTSTIPFNVELSAKTVGELLYGSSAEFNSDTEGRPSQRINETREAITKPQPSGKEGLDSAPKKTLVRGLVSAINKHFLEQAGGDQTLADEIAIEIAPGFGIESALLKKVGTTSKEQTFMASPAADQLLSSKQFFSSDGRNYSILAGTQIVQLLDLVMRSSSYITDQQLYEVTENTSPKKSKINSDSREVIDKEKTKSETATWYSIKVDAVPKAVDPVSKKVSYKVTYLIEPYQAYVNHPAFPRTRYRGTHKKYDYWFTGQNTEILNFEIDYNYSYYTSISTKDSDLLKQQQRTSAREQEMLYLIETRPNQSGQGGIGDNTTAAASIAASLYSFADTAKSTMTIMGDPDWLSEGDFLGLKAGLEPWAPRGNGINYGSQEVLYEVNFNIATDYDLNTGLMDVGKGDYGRSDKTNQPGEAKYSFLYRPYQVTSNLRNGVFTQQINGLIATFTPSERAEVDNTAKPQSVSDANAVREKSSLVEQITGARSPLASVASSVSDNSVKKVFSANASTASTNGAYVSAPTDDTASVAARGSTQTDRTSGSGPALVITARRGQPGAERVELIPGSNGGANSGQ